MYDYTKDAVAQMCLEQASFCKTDIGFGAVAIKDSVVVGVGRNRKSTETDRRRLSHVDYAIHAEQDAVLNAIDNGIDVSGGEIFVFGVVLRGKNRGQFTVRSVPDFGCKKCPHTFQRYNLTIAIPHDLGWVKLTPDQAMEYGNKFHGNGTWSKFAAGTVKI